MSSTRIALIHATPVAMQPVSDAFSSGWPEAETMHLLDDSLSRDLARTGTLDAAMIRRFHTLATYALDTGADGILFTCSAFGAAIEDVAQSTRAPVLKPNEAMFAEALQRGTRLGLLATFAASIPSMEREFVAMAAARSIEAHLESVWVPDAMDALASGDAATHDRLLAAASPRLAQCDVIMLAQFSMACALPAVQQTIDCPVLTSPASAVAALKAQLGAE